ncbi:MAG: glycosyl hydrolase family 8 [Lachnospiraceae bacterium]|nr:glycosyl hydrolase family 8 [Lachnospiraceae bacterium]
MEYKNVFEKIGYGKEVTDERLELIFETLFYGNEDERIYHEAGDDMGYMVDTGNIDVRTEGMSYGMMMCVQMDKKKEFDRIWKWSKTYMYMDEGENKGFFAWSCDLNGEKNAYGPAPDGEEYFAMALFFAAHRWGNGEGIFNYEREAQMILHDMVHKGEKDGIGRSMFDRDNKMIRFICEVDFSDPSYHLPHFYELFAKWAAEEDREFFKDAAKASREYLKKACHPDTGMSAEYAHYDGRPYDDDTTTWGRHDWYYSDAYRTIMNICLDYSWFKADEWAKSIAETFADNFVNKIGFENWNHIFMIDGTMLEENALHPTAIIATNAMTALASYNLNTEQCLKKFFDTPLRSGDRRYYDNCLYFFCFMALSGNYRIY